MRMLVWNFYFFKMSKSLSLLVHIYRVIRKSLQDLFVNCNWNPGKMYELSCIYHLRGGGCQCCVSDTFLLPLCSSRVTKLRQKITCLLNSNFCSVGNVALKAYFCSLLQSGAAVIFGMLKYISLIVWMTWSSSSQTVRSWPLSTQTHVMS
jgi:hypothetical protein